MMCRICDIRTKSGLKDRRDDGLCRMCAYVMEVTIPAISQYWNDVIKERKSLRMKEYYKNMLVYDKSKIHRPRTGFRGHLEDYI